jgi:hypothetical protein
MHGFMFGKTREREMFKANVQTWFRQPKKGQNHLLLAACLTLSPSRQPPGLVD